MDVNPIERLSLLQNTLSDKMDKASFSPVTLTTLEARKEKVQKKDIRFHEAITEKVATSHDPLHAGITVVAAPKGSTLLG